MVIVVSAVVCSCSARQEKENHENVNDVCFVRANASLRVDRAIWMRSSKRRQAVMPTGTKDEMRPASKSRLEAVLEFCRCLGVLGMLSTISTSTGDLPVQYYFNSIRTIPVISMLIMMIRKTSHTTSRKVFIAPPVTLRGASKNRCCGVAGRRKFELARRWVDSGTRDGAIVTHVPNRT